MMLGWWLVDIGDLHVMPKQDLCDHVCLEDCVCGPSATLRERALGADAWIYIHHALDGRPAPLLPQ